MSNEEANELWDEIGKRATVRSKAAAKVVREGTNISWSLPTTSRTELKRSHLRKFRRPSVRI